MSDPVELAPAEPMPGPAPTRRDPAATRRRWVDRLARFRPAEQTVAAFCAAEGVSVPAFYQWRRTLAADAPSPSDGPAFVPVRVPEMFALGDAPTAEQLVDWLPDRWRLRTRDSPAHPATAA